MNLRAKVSAEQPLLQVCGLRVSFADPARSSFFRSARRPVLHDIGFTVAAGECLGIVGESGSGKTTLGRSLLRLNEPEAGEIRFAGQNLMELDEDALRPLRARMQMIFQDPLSSLNPRRRVRDIVLQPLVSFGRDADLQTRAARRVRAAQLLERVALPADFQDRYPGSLSGGQRQRVGIARAIALQPALIVADEIVSGLDVSTQARILLLLRDLQAELGMSVVFITHDLAVVRVLCDRVLVMHDGRIEEEGPVDRIFEKPRSAYTKALLAAIPLPDVDPHWLDDETTTPEGLPMKITDSICLVTGANRGLGREIVASLVAAGARKVYAASRKAGATDELVARYPDQVVAITLDITRGEQVAAAAVRCDDVQLLVNNAGINRTRGLIAAGSLDDARAEIETNYLGTLSMCQAFAPVLAANGGGAIVNVLSILAKIALPAMGSLCASKAAGLRLTEGVRAELAGQGTRVVALMTGALDTDMSRDFQGPKSNPSEVAAAIVAGLEAGQDEIFFGDMCDWVNGALRDDPKALEKEFAAFLPA